MFFLSDNKTGTPDFFWKRMVEDPSLIWYHSNETLIHNNIDSIYRFYFILNSYNTLVSYLRSTCLDNSCISRVAEMHQEVLYSHLVEENLSNK